MIRYLLEDASYSTEYGVGDQFIVVGEYPFDLGSVVELYRNPNSGSPLFKLVKGGCSFNHADGAPGGYTNWAGLRSTTKVADEDNLNNLRKLCKKAGMTFLICTNGSLSVVCDHLDMDKEVTSVEEAVDILNKKIAFMESMQAVEEMF